MLRTLLAVGVGIAGFLLDAANLPAADPVLPTSVDRWIRADTAHFTLFSDAGPDKTRDLALELERFRSVLLLLTQSADTADAVPTSVVLFRNDSSMAPYRPRFEGRSRSPIGFFQASRDGNTIALVAGGHSDAQRVVIHEYLHDFLHGHFPPQPLWYHEGAAEFFGTFRSESTEVRIGLPIPEHLRLLRESKLLPLAELFSVAHDSAEYHDASRQRLFYAESWALVHYLLRGAPQRTPQLARFLGLLEGGSPIDAAFREAFETDYETLLTELVRYVHGHRFPEVRAAFGSLPLQPDVRVIPIGAAEALYRLGDLLLHSPDDRDADAEAHFRAALEIEPRHAGALAGLALTRVAADRLEEADRFYRESISAGSDDFRTYFRFGRLRMRAYTGRTFVAGHLEPEESARIEEARAAFRRSLSLNGDFAEARVELGRTFLLDETAAVPEGIGHLEAALARLRSRDDIVLDLARLYERIGDRAKADALLRKTPGEHARSLERQTASDRERRDCLVRVNELLGEGREDEAIADLDALVAAAPPGVRDVLGRQAVEVRESAARRRSVRDYNEAVARANRRDLPGALDLFRIVAASAGDPDLARSARERAGEIERALSRRRASKKR
ncbi:MAG: DUF1570 domain-containing protein [Acidobacteriota bacterium]